MFFLHAHLQHSHALFAGHINPISNSVYLLSSRFQPIHFVSVHQLYRNYAVWMKHASEQTMFSVPTIFGDVCVPKHILRVPTGMYRKRK